MNIEDKLKRIYEEIADKNLSFGCVIKRGDTLFKIQSYDETDENYIKVGGIQFLKDGKVKIGMQIDTDLFRLKEVGFEIIGHPVMIGNVLDWMYKNLNVSEQKKLKDKYGDFYYYLLNIWKDKTKPIDNEVEVIDYIFPLLPKKGEGFELKGDIRYAGQANQDYLSKIDLGTMLENK